MAATGSPTRIAHPSHLDITPADFERRLAAHGHTADEIHGLWDELLPAEVAEPRGLALGPTIAVYLGLLLVVAASVSLLAIYWHGLGAAGILAVAVAYLAGYLGTGEILRRRGLTPAADVLEAVAVAWVGLATYAVQELAGVWPDGASDSNGIHSGLTVIAIVGIAAALVLLRLRPDPLLLVPMAAGTALLAADLAEAVYGATLDDLSSRQSATFVLPVGLAWIALGLWLDAGRRRDYATWAHWVGLAITGFAVVAMVPKTVPGFVLIGVLGAIALFFSAFDRHWSFTIVGALGVLIATMSSMKLLGGMAPLFIAVAGIALIFVGVRWSRWRDSIRGAVLARMPDTVRDLLGRLAQ
jgi:hypothetical protein